MKPTVTQPPTSLVYITNFEKHLSESLDRTLQSPSHQIPEILSDSIRYSLLAPGKRMRPKLLLHCAEMIQLPFDAALPAAIALEMLHCFTLIHDDLPCMDNDDYRRGMLSNHKKFGESVALLAGDALMSMAMELFLESASALSQDAFLKGFQRFLTAVGPHGVIGGQAAEMQLSIHSTLQDLEKMHAQKTGALFTASLLIPTDFKEIHSSEEGAIALKLFAKELGYAFQIADDLEDSQQDNGKPLNILFYMPKDQACHSALKRLQHACDSLQAAWGGGSHALISTAQTVLQKIESYSQ